MEKDIFEKKKTVVMGTSSIAEQKTKGGHLFSFWARQTDNINNPKEEKLMTRYKKGVPLYPKRKLSKVIPMDVQLGLGIQKPP